MSKKKKTVTVPKTFDPGLGRPKEHLAYLNYQEMEALKRLNGEGPKKGPKGIPSFVLGSATTSGTAANRAMTSAAQSNRPTTSTTSRIGSAASAQRSGPAYSSPSTTSRIGSAASAQRTGSAYSSVGGTGRPTTSTTSRIGSAASAQRVGAAYSGVGGTGRTVSVGGTGRPTGTVSTTSRIGSAASAQRTGPAYSGDSAAKRQAESANTRNARQNPAYRDDASKGAAGERASSVSTKLGDKVFGALRDIREIARTGVTPAGPRVPRATVTLPANLMSTQGTSFTSPQDAAYRNMVVTGNRLAGLSPSGSVPTPAELRAQTEDRARTARLAQQYSLYRSPPSMPPADFVGANSPFADVSRPASPIVSGYPSAPQGVFGPRVSGAPSYLRSVSQPGMITTGMPSGYSGVPPRQSAEATLRAYEAEKRASVTEKIQDRVPASDPNARKFVPGLITYPGLNRPEGPSPKTIQDRLNVLPSNEQSLYTGAGAFGVPGSQKDQSRIPPSGAYRGLPKPPVVAGGETQPSRDPAVIKALAAAGFNPDGTRMKPGVVADKYSYPIGPTFLSPEGNIPWARPEPKYPAPIGPQRPNVATDKYSYPIGPRLLSDEGNIPWNRSVENNGSYFSDISSGNVPAALSAPSGFQYRDQTPETPGLTGPDVGGGSFLSSLGKVASDTATGIGALLSGGFRTPGDIISGPEGLRVVNPDLTESPYPGPGKPIQDRIPQSAGPLSPLGQYLDKAPGYTPPQVTRNIPAPTGEESVSGVRAIPAPSSIGILSDGGAAVPQRQVTVKPGDSLSKIARENGVSVNKLIEANPQIRDPNKVRSGDRIVVPGKTDQGEGDGEAPSYEGENTAEGVTGPENAEVDTVGEGEARSISPSQGGLTPEQREKADEIFKLGEIAIRGGTTIAGTVLGVPTFGAGKQLSKAYKNSVLERLEKYASMTPSEKAVAEAKNPELIDWGRRLDIPTVNDYATYQKWATERGLRGQADFSRGGGGIEALPGGYYGSYAKAAPSPDGGGGGGGGGSGSRPQIYYMWDLGVNIPSPGDPNYTQYQTYLADRLAAQRAMGWA